MNLRTEIQSPAFPFHIQHQTPVYFAGSCFSDHIASQLSYHGFHVKANSHGIIYNPVSLGNAISDTISNKKYLPTDLLEYQGKWISLSHHGVFSRGDADEALLAVNDSIKEHHPFLKTAGVIFITLGTSWVYEYMDTGKIVANCHKIPGSQFKKRILSATEIHEALISMIEEIQQFSPSLQIVFTLSPVKHLKDGFIENTYSKSLLHAAIQQVLKPHVHYFPAYEIMIDDLRDYRFWSADMVHPNDLAIDYIFEKFSSSLFSDHTREIMKEVKTYRQFNQHRPLSKNPTEVEQLEKEKLNRKKLLLEKYPYIYL